MTFLVAKAALAATVVGIGVTFVALTFLSQRGQENGNNGLIDGIRKDGGDCHCKAIQECSTFLRGGFFRQGRSCGLQGFQRKVCCDERPSHLSKSPRPPTSPDKLKVKGAAADAHLSKNIISQKVAPISSNKDDHGSRKAGVLFRSEVESITTSDDDRSSTTGSTAKLVEMGQQEEEQPTTIASKLRLDLSDIHQHSEDYQDDKLEEFSTQVPYLEDNDGLDLETSTDKSTLQDVLLDI